MADRNAPLLGDAKRELARLTDDVKQMAGLRWQLASLELRAAVGQIKRLAIVGGIAAVIGLASLPVLVVYAAEMLDGLWLSRPGWLLALGLGLLVLALLTAWLAVRHFRGQFVGLEETLEELREDLVWLEEWVTESRGEGREVRREG